MNCKKLEYQLKMPPYLGYLQGELGTTSTENFTFVWIFVSLPICSRNFPHTMLLYMNMTQFEETLKNIDESSSPLFCILFSIFHRPKNTNVTTYKY